MQNANKTPKTTFKRILRKSKAVSPVIATLILIVVAIVGAISVGLIMSRVSSDTAGQANVQNAIGNSQQSLVVGGSSVIAPVIQAAIPQIEAQEHISVQYVTSSSGQGLEGVFINALDIGAVASLPSLQSGISYASSSYPGVNVVSTLVGGSGVVVIENGGAGSFLTDGANVCYGITKAALAAIYQPTGTGYFTINAAACVHGYLDASGITTNQPATTAHAIETVYRSDSSAIQDTFSGYIGVSDKGTPAYAGAGEVGDAGVLSTVQSAPGANNPGGWIGFIDFGYAEGAAAGVAGGDADGVSIAQVFTSTSSTGGLTGETFGPLTGAPYSTGTYTTPAVTTPAGYPLAILDGSSAANVSNLILSGLQQSTSSVFPDTAAVPGKTLTTNFYFVTDGNPTTTEENFISFFTSSSATSEALWTSNGFFTLYQINSGA